MLSIGKARVNILLAEQFKRQNRGLEISQVVGSNPTLADIAKYLLATYKMKRAAHSSVQNNAVFYMKINKISLTRLAPVTMKEDSHHTNTFLFIFIQGNIKLFYIYLQLSSAEHCAWDAGAAGAKPARQTMQVSPSVRWHWICNPAAEMLTSVRI